MGEETDTGLLREIDEELRQEHYAKLWSRYGTIIIAAVVILIGSVAGYKGWQSYDMSQRLTHGQQFAIARATEARGDLMAAQEQFSRLAHEGTTGYRILAKFRTAALLAQNGDSAGAATTFRSLVTDPDTPTGYRDLALILGAMNGLNAGEPPAMVAQSLSAITGEQNPWRHTAREIMALANMEAGNRDAAIETLTMLSADAAAPAGVRGRAQEMLLALGHTSE